MGAYQIVLCSLQQSTRSRNRAGKRGVRVLGKRFGFFQISISVWEAAKENVGATLDYLLFNCEITFGELQRQGGVQPGKGILTQSLVPKDLRLQKPEPPLPFRVVTNA